MSGMESLHAEPVWGARYAPTMDLDIPRFTESALCAQADADEWFPDKGGNPSRAKAVCGRCLARDECLAWALAHDEHGVWAGTTRKQRLQMQRGNERRQARNAARCGTTSGYRRHRYLREQACDPCRLAESQYQALRRARRQAGAA